MYALFIYFSKKKKVEENKWRIALSNLFIHPFKKNFYYNLCLLHLFYANFKNK